MTTVKELEIILNNLEKFDEKDLINGRMTKLLLREIIEIKKEINIRGKCNDG